MVKITIKRINYITLILFFGFLVFSQNVSAQETTYIAKKSSIVPIIDGYSSDWSDTWDIIEMDGLSGLEIPNPNIEIQACHNTTHLFMIFRYHMYLSTDPLENSIDFWTDANGNGEVLLESGDDNIELWAYENISTDQNYFFGWIGDSSQDVTEFNCSFDGVYWIYEFSHLLQSNDIDGDDFKLQEGDSIEFIISRTEQPYGVSFNNASYSLTLTIETDAPDDDGDDDGEDDNTVPGFSLFWFSIGFLGIGYLHIKKIKKKVTS